MDAVLQPLPWVTRTLARLGMPPQEIASVLRVEEPSLLRGYFELHGERSPRSRIFLVERLPALEQEWKERREALQAAGQLPEAPGPHRVGKTR